MNKYFLLFICLLWLLPLPASSGYEKITINDGTVYCGYICKKDLGGSYSIMLDNGNIVDVRSRDIKIIQTTVDYEKDNDEIITGYGNFVGTIMNIKMGQSVTMLCKDGEHRIPYADVRILRKRDIKRYPFNNSIKLKNGERYTGKILSKFYSYGALSHMILSIQGISKRINASDIDYVTTETAGEWESSKSIEPVRKNDKENRNNVQYPYSTQSLENGDVLIAGQPAKLNSPNRVREYKDFNCLNGNPKITVDYSSLKNNMLDIVVSDNSIYMKTIVIPVSICSFKGINYVGFWNRDAEMKDMSVKNHSAVGQVRSYKVHKGDYILLCPDKNLCIMLEIR